MKKLDGDFPTNRYLLAKIKKNIAIVELTAEHNMLIRHKRILITF